MASFVASWIDSYWITSRGRRVLAIWGVGPEFRQAEGKPMVGIKQRDLERRFKMSEVDDGELQFLLMQFFPSGRYVSAWELELGNEAAGLKVVYAKKSGRICELVPGVGLTEDLVAKIEREIEEKLGSPAVSKVARLILYAGLPVVGYWRYRDRIILRQVPAGAPQAPQLWADHPLVCEIQFDGANDPWVNMLRSRRESRQLALLLTLLVRSLRLPEASSQGWVLTPTLSAQESDSVASELRSEYAHFGYIAPSDLGDSDFLSKQGDLSSIILEPEPYGVSIGSTLTLREDIEGYIDAYFRLPDGERRKLLRAAYWLNVSKGAFRISRSASFQSLVQAVEALTVTPAGQPKCSECDRTIGIGPTKLFQEFISKYAPSAGGGDDERMYKMLYEKRSQLTHGNTLLEVDEEIGLTAPSPNQMAEDELHRKGSAICRDAILGWLRYHAVQERDD
ncbi:hypothetical protein [Streptomyces sp. NPDC085529]|uniref:hypothetical protein n=1 Tax=Streptomyces sp. NPDC085529 TaxID=3365729 RepID=UPI0037D4B59A